MMEIGITEIQEFIVAKCGGSGGGEAK